RTDLPSRARSEDALKRVRALADLERHRVHFDSKTIARVIQANWGHADRPVRQAAVRLIADLPAAQEILGRHARTALEQTTFALGRVAQERGDALARCLEVVAAKKASSEARLAAVRVIQLALADLVAR